MAERAPNEKELLLLKKFGDALVTAQTELRLQLQLVRTVDDKVDENRTGGYLDLKVPQEAPDITDPDGFPIDGWYFDLDGGLVSLILHLGSGNKRLDTLERYKDDATPIAYWPPAASEVRVQRYVKAPKYFDEERGWYPAE